MSRAQTPKVDDFGPRTSFMVFLFFPCKCNELRPDVIFNKRRRRRRFHLREIKRLDVAPSSIPEAGRGLFTLTARARGDDLGEYMGELLQRRKSKGGTRKAM